MPWFFCECGAPLDRLDPRRRYCSYKCKKAADNCRARERREDRIERSECPRCGEEMSEQDLYEQRRTCVDCRARAAAAKRRWRAERWLWGDTRERRVARLRRRTKKLEAAAHQRFRAVNPHLFPPDDVPIVEY